MDVPKIFSNVWSFIISELINVISSKSEYKLLSIEANKFSKIVFIVLIVSMLLLMVFGNSINIVLQERFNIFSKIISFILRSKALISIVLLFIVFTMAYKFIPKNKYKMICNMPGAAIAAILCTLISIFYSMYVEIYTGFSVMYGSLTTIVLAMMWVYGCMYSILLGAVINKYLIDKRAN